MNNFCGIPLTSYNHLMNSKDSFACRQSLAVDGETFEFFSLPAFAQKAGVDLSRMPFSLKVMLENLLRNEDGRFVTKEQIVAVAGGSGGVPSIVESGITGLLSLPGDKSAFARSLRNLIDTPKRRGVMARAAFEKTRQLHDIAAAAQILDRALHHALLVSAPA